MVLLPGRLQIVLDVNEDCSTPAQQRQRHEQPSASMVGLLVGGLGSALGSDVFS